MESILIVIPILTALMFELGLNLEPKDFKLILAQPRGVVAGLIGQVILLPCTALLICKLCGLSPLMAVGLMLIACCPGGSSSNVFSLIAGGNVALSVSLTALSSVITLFTMPLIMAWVMSADASPIELPIENLLIQNIFLMLVPIVVGLLIRVLVPREAKKIDAVLSKCAFPALMILAVVYFIEEYKAIVENFAELGLSVCLLMGSAMLIGTLISRGFRLPVRDRRTIVIEVGMQNAAQAIAVAGSPFVFNNPAIAAPAIIYALVMNVALLTYVGFIKRRNGLTTPAGDAE